MKAEDYTLSGLYYRYKKRSDDEINNYLKKIKIVIEQMKGRDNSPLQYYPITRTTLKKIKTKPRGYSLTFDATTSNKPLNGLVPYKKIVYLVKSSSRFFLKPDIGEVFDQLDFRDLDSNLKAISLDDGYELLPDTDGEHFLMKATLLTKKK